DLVRIDYIRKERIKAGPAYTGKIRADFRSFAIKFVANEAGFLRNFMPGLQIHRAAVQDYLFLLFDNLLFVGISRTNSSDYLSRPLPNEIVFRFTQRTNGSQGKLLA